MGLTVVKADDYWSYSFGADGVLTPEAAVEMLGGCCERTLQRRVAERKIRRGKDGSRVLYCRRSVMDYLASLEQ